MFDGWKGGAKNIGGVWRKQRLRYFSLLMQILAKNGAAIHQNQNFNHGIGASLVPIVMMVQGMRYNQLCCAKTRLSAPPPFPNHFTTTPPTSPDAHGSVLELCCGARLLLVQGQSGRTVRGTLPRVAPVDLVELRVMVRAKRR